MNSPRTRTGAMPLPTMTAPRSSTVRRSASPPPRSGIGTQGVGEVGVDDASDHDPTPAVDLGPTDAPAAERPVLMPRERVRRLVVVTVEVEDAEVVQHSPIEPRPHSACNIDVEFNYGVWHCGR